ncbi:hypothetical protein KKA27_03560 [Patescibacteria group bacterium]|nr:hypothetical protein [Patescibacteria group bacterium]
MKRIFLVAMITVVVMLGVVSSGCVPHIVYSGRFAGYEVSSYSYVIKVLNGLSYTVQIRYGRSTMLEPGGETSIIVSKFDSTRELVITAVVFGSGGEIIGTATKKIRVPNNRHYRDDRSQVVWHITNFDRLRD